MVESIAPRIPLPRGIPSPLGERGCTFVEKIFSYLFFTIPHILFLVFLLSIITVAVVIKEKKVKNKIILILIMLVLGYFILLFLVRFVYFRGIIPFPLEKGTLWLGPKC